MSGRYPFWSLHNILTKAEKVPYDFMLSLLTSMNLTPNPNAKVVGL